MKLTFAQQLDNYWLANVATLHCTMCGNNGVIDSRGVRTPAGVEIGRLNWCICPNGQALKKQTNTTYPTEVLLNNLGIKRLLKEYDEVGPPC